MALPHHFGEDEGVAVPDDAELAAAVRRAQRGNKVAIVDAEAHPVAAIVSLADAGRLRLDDLRRERAAQAIRDFGQVFAGEAPEDLEHRVVAAIAEAEPVVWAERFPDDE